MAAAQLDALPPSKRKKLRYEADWLQITPGERARVVAGGGTLICVASGARLKHNGKSIEILPGKIQAKSKWRRPTHRLTAHTS